jgi:hypothetical protein
MSFLDKVKSGVRSGAGQAATRAQQELERVQAKRALQQAFGELGKKTFELADRGDISNAELTPLMDRVRAARADVDAIGKQPEPAPDTTAEPEQGAEPAYESGAGAADQTTEFPPAG